MKLSLKQILASAAGATLAALLASAFGVKGTVIGVAIGSALATVTTTLVAQSIEHGHKVVRQVVVQSPRSGDLLRRVGQTDVAGEVSASQPEDPTVVVEQSSSTGGTDPSSPEPRATGDDVPTPAARGAERGPLPIRWPILLGTIGAVFVIALVTVTCIELVAGRPLSTLVGSNPGGSGTSIGQAINPGPTTTTTTTTTTTSTTTTTTTVPAGSTTTTPPTTTTTGPSNGATTTSTSTTVPRSSTTTSSTTTSTTAPGATSTSSSAK